MKQADILRHARDYLDQLNDHIDPLSGAYLPAASAAWEEEVHKLFYFASKNLTQIILFDDKDDRAPFSITPQQRAGLVPADKALGLKELVDRINHAVDLRVCRGLSQVTIPDWLVKQGYLQPANTRRYLPTPKGQAMGISPVMLFSPSAQQFVFDNLDAIADPLQSYVPSAKRKRTAVDHPEILEGNRQAMELLSQGRHPLTQTPLDPGDPLGQERLRTCFAFVAQALGRALEAGYFTARQPFSLPRELWSAIPVCDSTMLMQFLWGVNDLIPDPTAVAPLSREPVMQFLTAQGLMREELTKAGRKAYTPTPQGNAMGITLGEGTNAKDGSTFTTTLYPAAVQQLLIEHMDELIALAAQG